MDTQVIAIDVNDPLAKDLNDISDVEEKLPGHVSGIREWFRWYKTPDDKPLNEFGFDEKALDKVCVRCPSVVNALFFPVFFFYSVSISTRMNLSCVMCVSCWRLTLCVCAILPGCALSVFVAFSWLVNLVIPFVGVAGR